MSENRYQFQCKVLAKVFAQHPTGFGPQAIPTFKGLTHSEIYYRSWKVIIKKLQISDSPDSCHTTDMVRNND